MNIHSLAKTSPFCRWILVKRVLIEGQSIAQAAQHFSISRRTVYKWLKRFHQEGFLGLLDRSSRPRRSPTQLPQRVIERIRALRLKRLTVTAIAHLLKLVRSTVAVWLKRLGLNRLRALEPHEPARRYEHQHPGDMLHLDIKQLARIEALGSRITGDLSKRSRGAGWERLHVCIDDYSRVAYAEILPDEKGLTAAGFLQRATEFFRACGVTVRRVLTDNGPCYDSTTFANHCRRLGLRHCRTRPYRPQTNGKAERFIRTLMEEWGRVKPFKHSRERSKDLPRWISYYNLDRVHSALGYLPPASRLPTVNNVLGKHN